MVMLHFVITTPLCDGIPLCGVPLCSEILFRARTPLSGDVQLCCDQLFGDVPLCGNVCCCDLPLLGDVPRFGDVPLWGDISLYVQFLCILQL